jgi:hypothetical protein
MKGEDSKVSRAEFEENMYHKFTDLRFTSDIQTLLSPIYENDYHPEQGRVLFENEISPLLQGEAWKGVEKS